MITVAEWEKVKQEAIKKWEDGVTQDKFTYQDWWLRVGAHECSFCRVFFAKSCSLCPLHDYTDCADEWGACDDAYMDDSYGKFHEASVALLARIRKIEYKDLPKGKV